MLSIPIKSNLHISLLLTYLQCSHCYSCFPSAQHSSKVEILPDNQITKYCRSFTQQSLLPSRKILTETYMILCPIWFSHHLINGEEPFIQKLAFNNYQCPTPPLEANRELYTYHKISFLLSRILTIQFSKVYEFHG